MHRLSVAAHAGLENALVLPAGTPDHWAAYRDGVITHFEALQSYFAAIRASVDEVLAVVKAIDLDPDLPTAIASLRRAGWRVVVTSAGCAWYIRKLLADAGVEIEVHANPGQFQAGYGLVVEMPTGSPLWSASPGVDKASVVRGYLEEGRTVGFAGDGFPDVEAARFVPARLRFARGDLATVLRSGGSPFREFATWSDTAGALIQGET
jgi:2-hydroxy-3-keto-5-methylthiopentenyl-1-phosphate phosphatase